MTNENYSSKSQKFLSLVKTASDVRIPLIQIREKNISARSLYQLTASVMTAIRSSSTKALVNERIDIAMAAGADGVHLTSRSVPLDVVRRHVPDGFVIGVSTHSIDDISAAQQGGADLAVLGPIFETPGKGEPIGIECLPKTVSAFPEFPILGLGGIDESNYRDVLAAGAAGFAAIRFLNNRQNLEKLSRELGL